MFYLLILKDTSEGFKELRVLDWHIKVGTLCTPGMLLVELESYKAVLEIRASGEAYLRKILVNVHQSQSSGKPLAVFSDSQSEPMPPSFAALEELAAEYLYM